MKNEEKKNLPTDISASDFVLRLVNIFAENDMPCKVSGDDQLTVTDEGQSFTVKVTKIP